MRRSLTSRLAMLAPVLALALLPASAGFANGPTAPPAGPPAADVVADTPAAERATEALEAAEALFAGQGAQAKGRSAEKHSPDDGHDHGDGLDRSATLVLGELARVYEDLDARQQKQADALLARPVETESQQRLGSNRSAVVNDCSETRFCVHYTTTGTHAATPTYANKVKMVMNEVWDQQVGRFGYRAPLPDGMEGGNPKFDVYLENLVDRGLLGFCAFDPGTVRKNRTAPTFCVLDRSYAGYGAQWEGYLRLTAAHEFFHAVQNSYDAYEDPWMKEASATWMEERFATDVNDNRLFLRFGQVRRPGRPLDKFAFGDGTAYGNWPFFEFISSRYGNGMVKRIWTKAAGPSNKSMSVKAIDRALSKKGGLAKNYARFASVNTAPHTQYAEGGQWSVKAPITQSTTVKKSKRTRNFSTKLKHLTSRNYNVRIKHRGLKGKKWKLGVRVVGPRRASGPGAHLLIHKKNGKIAKKQVKINKRGVGTATVKLGKKNVRRVTVTVANGSSRYRCNRGTAWACQGKPLDNGKRFKIRTTLRK